jgi:hypothetical protein
MATEPFVPAIAHVIQLAVAPVFLLSGVGVIITVLTNRLGRIVDRARALEEKFPHIDPAAEAELDARLAVLARRSRMVNLALTLATSCALLICMVIVALFTGGLFRVDLSGLIGALFVAAMLAFIGALVSFLREIFLATGTVRIGRA